MIEKKQKKIEEKGNLCDYVIGGNSTHLLERIIFSIWLGKISLTPPLHLYQHYIQVNFFDLLSQNMRISVSTIPNFLERMGH